MKKIFFLGYGGGHINALIPVIKMFQKDSNYEVVAIGINLAADTLRKNGIPCKTLSNYMTEEVLNIGHPLALKFHNFNSTVSYADSISYYGFSMKDLIADLGKDLAWRVFKLYDRRLMLPVNSMKYILQKEQPDVVVATTMHRFEAATIIAANELGIPSVKIEDLVGNVSIPFPDKLQANTEEEYKELLLQGFTENQIVLKSELEQKDILEYRDRVRSTYLNMQPDRICVVSDYVKSELIRKGKLEESIRVTGQPAFDALLKWNDVDENRIIDQLGLDKSRPIFSYMSQPLSNRAEILELVIETIRDIEGVQLVIKLHPNENGDIQRLVLQKMNYNAVITKEISSAEITKISTITSTVTSTTGLEAACLNRDLVYFNFFDEDNFVPFNEMGIGVRITSVADGKEIIKAVLSGEEQYSHMKDNRKSYIKNLGKGAENVYNVIKELL